MSDPGESAAMTEREANVKAEVSIRIWIDENDELNVSKSEAVGASSEDRKEVNHIAVQLVGIVAESYDREDISSLKVNGEELLEVLDET